MKLQLLARLENKSGEDEYPQVEHAILGLVLDPLMPITQHSFSNGSTSP